MAWTKEQTEAVTRNKAIQARNRFFEEHGDYLGMSKKPMELIPVPASVREQDEIDNQQTN